MRTILRKEIVDGVKFKIVETEQYIEYLCDRELILGYNKDNKTILHNDEMQFMPYEESELNLLTEEEVKELMLKDLSLHISAINKMGAKSKNLKPRKSKRNSL